MTTLKKVAPVNEAAISAIPSIKLNFSWMLFGNLFYGFCQWGLLIVIAKLTNPETVGRFSLGLAVSAPVVMFFNMQVRSIFATDEDNQFTFADYFGFRLLTNFIAFFVVSAIVYCAGYRDTTALVILILAIAKLSESTSDITMGIFQKRETMHVISKSLMLRGALALCAMAVTVYFTRNLVWGVTMMTAAWASVLFFHDLPMGRIVAGAGNDSSTTEGSWFLLFKDHKFKPNFCSMSAKRLAVLALPLGFVSLLLSLNTNIPKYFIESMLGQKALGYYASMAYLILIGAKFINAMGQAVMPRLAKTYFSGNRKRFFSIFWKCTVACGFLGGFIVLLSICFGKIILKALYGPEYATHSSVFTWIMVSGAFEYLATFFWLCLIVTRQIRIQVPFNLLYIACLVLACVALIPEHGLAGAAYALVIACFLKAFCNMLLLFKEVLRSSNQ